MNKMKLVRVRKGMNQNQPLDEIQMTVIAMGMTTTSVLFNSTVQL